MQVTSFAPCTVKIRCKVRFELKLVKGYTVWSVHAGNSDNSSRNEIFT